MLTCTDIRRLLITVRPGTTLRVHDIQRQVGNRFILSHEDLEPHTTTRKTTYARYKHRIQGVLSGLKKEKRVDHDPKSQTYRF